MPLEESRAAFDLIIRNGTIIDGIGSAARPGDVAVKERTIAPFVPSAPRVLDAAGAFVTSGFVDIYSHADLAVILPDHVELLKSLAMQEITTIIGGNCGSSNCSVSDEGIALLRGGGCC